MLRPFIKVTTHICALALSVASTGSATTEDRVPTLLQLKVAPEEYVAEFQSAGEPFSGTRECRRYLAALIPMFTRAEYVIARGPYPVLENDYRIHAISVSSGDYIVTEYRCLGPSIEARSWAAGPATNDVRPYTLEDIQKMTFPPEEKP